LETFVPLSGSERGLRSLLESLFLSHAPRTLSRREKKHAGELIDMMEQLTNEFEDLDDIDGADTDELWRQFHITLLVRDTLKLSLIDVHNDLFFSSASRVIGTQLHSTPYHSGMHQRPSGFDRYDSAVVVEDSNEQEARSTVTALRDAPSLSLRVPRRVLFQTYREQRDAVQPTRTNNPRKRPNDEPATGNPASKHRRTDVDRNDVDCTSATKQNSEEDHSARTEHSRPQQHVVPGLHIGTVNGNVNLYNGQSFDQSRERRDGRAGHEGRRRA
jgi:hypothetical protein